MLTQSKPTIRIERTPSRRTTTTTSVRTSTSYSQTCSTASGSTSKTSSRTLSPMILSTETNRKCSKIKHSPMLIAKSEAIALNHRKRETIRKLKMREKTTLTLATATVMDTTALVMTLVHQVQLVRVLQEHQLLAQFHSRLGRLSLIFQA